MKISDASPISNKGSKAKKTSKASGPAFASFLSDGEEISVESAKSITPVTAVNIINEVEDINPDERKKQAVQHGFDLLEELEKIRDGLLFGSLTSTDLQRAYSLVSKQKDNVDDPELAFLINEIEVRTSVELAKLGLI